MECVSIEDFDEQDIDLGRDALPTKQHEDLDILTMSAAEIAKEIYDKAYGGKSPNGLVDFASSCIFSPVPRDSPFSDYHAEFWPIGPEYMEQESEAKYRGAVVNRPYDEPPDTDPPILHQFGSAPIKGTIGEALRAWLEIAALEKEQGGNVAQFLALMRETFGIPDSVQLHDLIPALRSTGEMAVAGLDKKLTPAVLGLENEQRLFNLVDHGRTRKDFKGVRHVDWARLKANFQGMVSQFVAEDLYFPQLNRRIDYKIIGRELPQIAMCVPVDYSLFGIKGKIVPNKQVIDYLAELRKDIIHGSEFARIRAKEIVVFDEDVSLPPFIAMKTAKQLSIGNLPPKFVFDEPDYEKDLGDRPQNIQRKWMADYAKTPEKMIDVVLYPIVVKKWDDIVTKKNRVDETIGPTEVSAISRTFVDALIPEDFFFQIHALAYVIHRDGNDAQQSIYSVMKMLKVPDGCFSKPKYRKLWETVSKYPQVINAMAKQLDRLVALHANFGSKTFLMTTKIGRILKTHGLTELGFSEIMRQRRNWWCAEYRRRAQHVAETSNRKDKRGIVRYQLRAKLFQHVCLYVSKAKGIEVKWNKNDVVQAMIRIAAKFMRKKARATALMNIGFYEKVIQLTVGATQEPSLAAILIDAYMDKHRHGTVVYTFQEALDEVMKSAAFFRDDLQNIFDNMTKSLTSVYEERALLFDELPLGEQDGMLDEMPGDIEDLLEYEDDEYIADFRRTAKEYGFDYADEDQAVEEHFVEPVDEMEMDWPTMIDTKRRPLQVNVRDMLPEDVAKAGYNVDDEGIEEAIDEIGEYPSDEEYQLYLQKIIRELRAKRLRNLALHGLHMLGGADPAPQPEGPDVT